MIPFACRYRVAMCVLAMALAACSSTTSPDAIVSGTWGGDHALLEITATGAAIEFDCAHGSIFGPLDVGSDGAFKWKGTLTLEGGPSPIPAPQPRDVVYVGKVNGDQMAISYVGDNGIAQGPWMLTWNTKAFLHKCQ